MKLYHRTPAADAVLAEGFRDARGNYGMRLELEGVWLSDVPLSEQEGAEGASLLEIIIDETFIADNEVIEVGKPYREWIVPAALLNRSALVRLTPSEEGDDGDARRPESGALSD